MHNFAISCMSGRLNGIHSQGVLTAFEEATIKADTCASSSSSTVSTSYATIGEIGNQNISSIYWIKPEVNLKELGVDFTKASKEEVKKFFNMGLKKKKNLSKKISDQYYGTISLN